MIGLSKAETAETVSLWNRGVPTAAVSRRAGGYSRWQADPVCPNPDDPGPPGAVSRVQLHTGPSGFVRDGPRRAGMRAHVCRPNPGPARPGV
jgi:hypothetical protein